MFLNGSCGFLWCFWFLVWLEVLVVQVIVRNGKFFYLIDRVARKRKKK